MEKRVAEELACFIPCAAKFYYMNAEAEVIRRSARAVSNSRCQLLALLKLVRERFGDPDLKSADRSRLLSMLPEVYGVKITVYDTEHGSEHSASTEVFDDIDLSDESSLEKVDCWLRRTYYKALKKANQKSDQRPSRSQP